MTGLRGRRGGGTHLDRAGEAGDLGANPHAQALAEFVGDNCTGRIWIGTQPKRRTQQKHRSTAGEAIGGAGAYRIVATSGRQRRRGRGRRGCRGGGRCSRMRRGLARQGSPSNRSPSSPRGAVRRFLRFRLLRVRTRGNFLGETKINPKKLSVEPGFLLFYYIY
jgi:hypothetical protein